MEISLATVTTDRWEVVGSIASTVNAITSLVAISFVAIQLKSSNRIAQAQLINELERDIALDTDIYVAITKNSTELTDNEQIGILRCISFFGRVHLILDTKVVDIATIDKIFAGRFFNFFNNPKVQALVNSEERSPYMTTIRELYDKWYDYRKGQGLPIPRHSLQDLPQ